MLRSHVKAGSELGKKAKSFMDSGKLVPDDLLIGMILSEIEVADTDRILLDGFPRTKPQAEALDAKTKIGMALNLQVPSEDIVKRASMRWCTQRLAASTRMTTTPRKSRAKMTRQG